MPTHKKIIGELISVRIHAAHVFAPTVGPTMITLHEVIVLGLIIEFHYICSVCLN